MDISSFKYNSTIESIVDILVNKTQNYNRDFFRLQTNFYLSLIPSVMNVKVNSPITGTVPLNFYGLNLSNSGSGKGYSTNLLEDKVLNEFKYKFSQETFINQVRLSLDNEALVRSNNLGTTHDEALEALEKEFKIYGGEFKFAFDSATSPAIKQFRSMLLLAKIGSINFIIDEIGANLKSNLEPLYVFLELFDKGVVKDKLIKATQDNARYREITGSTPANLLLFGTPSKLLDGGVIEETFYELLEMGYARRCFFAFSKKDIRVVDIDPEKLYELIADASQDATINNLSLHLSKFANPILCNTVIHTDRDTDLFLLKYRHWCEQRAAELPEHQEIIKSELCHRYFKVLKLAATYSFIEGEFTLKMESLHQAIKFAENSGEALVATLNREKPYERLAKFIADGRGKKFTQVDLVEELPYYKGTAIQKNELMSMAIAWGYTNNIIIKRYVLDGIDFFSGESLKETDLTKIKISYSTHFSKGYINDSINWEVGFNNLIKAPNYHWTNHFTSNGNRNEESMQEGFNCVVLDVDKDITIPVVRELLKDYAYIIHTTKRHQLINTETGECNDRFRIIIPTNYELYLGESEFTLFMKNVQQWCPFELDTQTFQRSRKWACNDKAIIFKNEGILLDVLPFIPKTHREVEFNKFNQTLGSMDNIQRWFALQMQNGNRNNLMLKYALMLLDGGMYLSNIKENIISFNNKLPNPLHQSEIESTVFITLTKRFDDK